MFLHAYAFFAVKSIHLMLLTWYGVLFIILIYMLFIYFWKHNWTIWASFCLNFAQVSRHSMKRGSHISSFKKGKAVTLSPPTFTLHCVWLAFCHTHLSSYYQIQQLFKLNTLFWVSLWLSFDLCFGIFSIFW